MVFGEHDAEAQPERLGLSVITYPEQLHPAKEPTLLVISVVRRRRRGRGVSGRCCRDRPRRGERNFRQRNLCTSRSVSIPTVLTMSNRIARETREEAKVPRINLFGNSPGCRRVKTVRPYCLGVVPRVPQISISQVSIRQVGTT